MKFAIAKIEIRFEDDVVFVRQQAKEISGMLGFDAMDQARIATAVSEIARNAYNYAGGGTVDFVIDESGDGKSEFGIHIVDSGPGIPELPAVLANRVKSETGAGMGIVSARRLMDDFQIESKVGEGTRVSLRKQAPKSLSRDELTRIHKGLANRSNLNPVQEIREQNKELMRALEELRYRQEELERLNRELEDTNRGVVALYAELDEKAGHLRRADELKSRFLSNMSHEFRTPLTSISALCRLLLERVDGDLNEEQVKQITFIQKNAQDLTELVSDLLDLAKVEAGRISVNAGEVDVTNLFGALRGMFRPLLINPALKLVFEEPESIPKLYTDESKISQILRNFISNALKFTEAGEVRVRAGIVPANNTVVFSVLDTGIGIAPEDYNRIFEEFTQLDNPIQKRVRGTGLGLPLTRKLAELLGGRVYLESQLGEGSTFYAEIPSVYKGAGECGAATDVSFEVDPTRNPVLVVEDNSETLLLYEKYLKGTGFQVISAKSTAAAREALRQIPAVSAIILDVILPGEGGLDFLSQLKSTPELRDIPVVVISVMEQSRKALALGAIECAVKPVDRKWLVDTLKRVGKVGRIEKALVIDDDETSRYLIKGFLADTRYDVIEAGRAADGLALARDQQPAVIFLDLLMPEMNGFELLRKLRQEPELRDIPVVVVTSMNLSGEEQRELSRAADVILFKSSFSEQGATGRIRGALIAATGRARISGAFDA